MTKEASSGEAVIDCDKCNGTGKLEFAGFEAENLKLREALEASIAANELVLAQLRGGQDLTEAQVTKAMNTALAKARAALAEQEGK